MYVWAHPSHPQLPGALLEQVGGPAAQAPPMQLYCGHIEMNYNSMFYEPTINFHDP